MATMEDLMYASPVTEATANLSPAMMMAIDEAQERIDARKAQEAQDDEAIKQIVREYKAQALVLPTRAEIDDMQAKHRAKVQAALSVLREYGNVDSLSENDQSKLYQIHTALEACRQCKGSCQRPGLREGIEYVVSISDGKLEVEERECTYKRAERTRRWYRSAELPPKYYKTTWADYAVDSDNERAVDIAKKLIGTNKGAYFYGKPGCGKTLLVSLIAKDLIAVKKQVAFITLPTLSLSIRSTYKSGGSEFQILDRLYKMPVLIIDDVGMEKPTRFLSSMISNLFNERYNRQLQTFVTSNYPLKQIESTFNNTSEGETLDGTRMYDRCKQMCIPVEMKGGSRR